MSKFIIEPHFRLQEWVAEEKGYFRAEGLDYEFRELVKADRRPGARDQGQGRRLSVAEKLAARRTSAAPAIGR